MPPEVAIGAIGRIQVCTSLTIIYIPVQRGLIDLDNNVPDVITVHIQLLQKAVFLKCFVQ